MAVLSIRKTREELLYAIKNIIHGYNITKITFDNRNINEGNTQLNCRRD